MAKQDEKQLENLLDDCRVLQPFVTQYMQQRRSAAEAWAETQQSLSGICRFPWDQLEIDEHGIVKPRAENDQSHSSHD